MDIFSYAIEYSLLIFCVFGWYKMCKEDYALSLLSFLLGKPGPVAGSGFSFFKPM